MQIPELLLDYNLGPDCQKTEHGRSMMESALESLFEDIADAQESLQEKLTEVQNALNAIQEATATQNTADNKAGIARVEFVKARRDCEA